MMKSTISMKRIISLLAAMAASCMIALAQNAGTVELLALDGTKTTPEQWVDGKTPYVVSFWFVACKYCIEEMDAISEVFDEWQAEEPFRFIAVCTDDTRSIPRAKALVKGRGWEGFDFVFDINRDYSRAMNVTSCPHVFLFDKDGKLVYFPLASPFAVTNSWNFCF